MLRSQGWYVCSTDAFSFVLTAFCLLAWLELLPVIVSYGVVISYIATPYFLV